MVQWNCLLRLKDKISIFVGKTIEYQKRHIAQQHGPPELTEVLHQTP